MSVNSSSNTSLNPSRHHCHKMSFTIFKAFFINYILLLPLFSLVLYIGLKRWRKQRSVATAAIISHSDVFTFNVVVLELIGVLGCCLYCSAVYSDDEFLILAGMNIFSDISPGENLFHLLTCVERYLAVVHPITYMRMRQRGGVRIRNISIVCVWLLCFGIVGLYQSFNYYVIINGPLLIGISCIIVLFCSLSVLCVLIRPGPGDEGRNRKWVDESKLRVFQIITAIMGTLLMKFLSVIVAYVTYYSLISFFEVCLLTALLNWLSLPSSLVLPLLFLHRAGKLPGCKRNTESG